MLLKIHLDSGHTLVVLVASIYAIAGAHAIKQIHRRPNEPFLLVTQSLSALQPRLVGVPLAVPKGVGKLLQRAPDELRLLPQIGGQEAVCVGDGREAGLERVLEGLGRTGRGCVGILNTGELEETLDSGRSDKGGTARGRDKLKGKSMVSIGPASDTEQCRISQHLLGQ